MEEPRPRRRDRARRPSDRLRPGEREPPRLRRHRPRRLAGLRGGSGASGLSRARSASNPSAATTTGSACRSPSGARRRRTRTAASPGARPICAGSSPRGARRHDTPLRVGWVGCGVHATEMLLPQLVRPRRPPRRPLRSRCRPARDRRARYGVALEDTTPDRRALLARSDLDAVGVAAGPDAHLEIGLAALDRRLPLFLEKPPARSAAETRRARRKRRKPARPPSSAS